jgi:parallel beta-helix repeat protein
VSFGKSARVEGVIFQGNVLFANNHNGILVKRGENIEIRNNTFFNNGCQGINLGDGDGTNLYSVTFVNNIVVQAVNGNCKENCTWYPLAHLDTGKNASLVHATNNLYWPDQHIYGIEDKKPVFADPEFKDSRNSDFHLGPGSPAIDSGVFVGAPFTGTAPDLGALEYLGKESEYAIVLKGFLVGKSVILSWETTLPEHLRLFDVERSLDYVQYEKIAEVAGGTGSSYQYIDKNPVPDRCYYRVIQRDLDGSTRFSSAIEIRPGR